MYVCLCHNVTDSDIHRLVRTEGVCTVRQLGEHLGVATQCGKCAKCAKEVLREARQMAAAESGCPALMAAA
ncbi:(2Fe-2S)-binding protein [Betaproteobacteria bacterium SCN1]|jgi:bacterioferritin-associated ferredoxin|nr:(2Fe-2S)-binding protein [Betaproteobacteria bacterium SCN1]MBN8761229.1 (2Fe-2S)-binding protein [Thiobacillus sp.]ODU88469.1 MAG: (2Fe-2S)-binding protein [Thiobacillus sp. SCN 65-179]OJW36447.1 MAG: (2Fe-2S)-binding protein [Thiobacillus sp. 65-69]